MTLRLFPLTLFQLFCISFFAFSQKGILTGKITDAKTKEELVGVTISPEQSTGTLSDVNGNYTLELDAGNYPVIFSYVGYETQQKEISIEENQTITLNIQLSQNVKELNLVVVSASKYEKKITDETVSMEVLKPSFIANTNPIGMDDAIKQVPGVTMIDNQVNIRGGSGFSYGAGTRVLILVDDIPQLTADANDVKWEFLPIENINQVEVIKGASSVLYGSSALNGVINIRTNYPTSTPVTHINAYQGYFLNPERKEMIWWGNRQPHFGGGNFFHSRKFGQFDLVVGGNLYNESSYHEGEYTQRARMNVNTRYRFKHIDGLSAGVNANYMYFQSGTYFLWADDTTGAYRAFGGLDTPATTVAEGKNTRFNVDPFINYFSKNGDEHSLKMRYFYTRNNNNSNKSSTAKLYYGEYQYRKQFKFDLSWIAGITASYSDVVAVLYNNHHADNLAAFTQFDKRFGKLTVVAGVRYETFTVDTATGNSKPVFRAGLNFQLTKNTFLRASFGQGYRFPSIAEKYISTSVSVLKIFPNPEVQAESGWSTEVGVKRAFRAGNWLGYLDLAAFMQRYKDLIEFSFGYYSPNPIPGQFDLTYLGFKSINIENARVSGAEFSVIGEGRIGNVKTNLLAGITFINPINLHQKDFVDSLLANDNSLSSSQKDSLKTTEILNYRFQTTAKFNLDQSYKKFSWGVNMQYNSVMVNVDPFFLGTDPLIIYLYLKPHEFIPGVKEYRDAHNHGDYVIDLRFSYDLSDKVRFSFITKNILNREYSVRPALVEAPRSVQAEVSVRW
ncbi:MAG TPA: TonB-dependent receptor [Chitinophagales bacterium]|nr:TonB-dependent receptor [Chitinophagales bacterium]